MMLAFLSVSFLLQAVAATNDVPEAVLEVSSGGALLQVMRQKTKNHNELDEVTLHTLALEAGKVKRTEELAGARGGADPAPSLAAHDTKIQKECPLPVNATWCEVRLANLPPYMMAVRSGVDVVSNYVCSGGFWEVQDFSALGTPGNAMDIGGNMGYFTFALAHAGWHVITFEPMKANLDLMAATLCANPAFAQKVEIHPHGLGAQNTHCRFVFNKGNVGNGITRCQEDNNTVVGEDVDDGNFLYGDEEYQLRKFDEVLNELKAEGKLQALDFLKIDVEGYECEVLKGAPSFLTQFSPRLIKTEVWPHLERCEPAEYLGNFVNTGYALARDPACTQLAPDLVNAGGDYYACKGR